MRSSAQPYAGRKAGSPVRLPCLTTWFSGQPGLSRQYFAAGPDQCNFSHQLPDEQVAKRIEVLRDQDKSAGSTDHVVSIVLFEPTRRIRVLRTPRKPGVRENDQAVDRNTSRNGLVSRQPDITAAIVVAVSGHVDRTPLGVERCARELGQGKIDSTADGRAVSKGARKFQQLIAELLGGAQTLDRCPIDHKAL